MFNGSGIAKGLGEKVLRSVLHPFRDSKVTHRWLLAGKFEEPRRSVWILTHQIFKSGILH